MALGPIVLRSGGRECPDNPSLGYLARALNLPVHRPHHADGDALTTAQVFVALATRYRPGAEATVAELAYPATLGRVLSFLKRRRGMANQAPLLRPHTGD
jgi:DNA polymerase-3 subunit epsilon